MLRMNPQLWVEQQLRTSIRLVCTLLSRPLHDYDVKLPLVMRRFVGDLEHTASNYCFWLRILSLEFKSYFFKIWKTLHKRHKNLKERKFVSFIAFLSRRCKWTRILGNLFLSPRSSDLCPNFYKYVILLSRKCSLKAALLQQHMSI